MDSKTLIERLKNVADEQEEHGYYCLIKRGDLLEAIEALTPVAPADVRKRINRLNVLAEAVAKQNWREFDMRIPAEPDRDADLVLADTAKMLERLWRQTQYLDIPYFLRRPDAIQNDVREHIEKLQQRIETQRQQLSKQIDHAEEQQQRIDELKQIIIEAELHDSACGITFGPEGFETGECDCYLSEWQEGE